MNSSKKSFLYFGYASNLLKERIHLNNPSAKRVAVAKLQGYRLGFKGHSARWHGSSATILPCSSSVVWGVVWEVSVEHLESLDAQEGVHLGVYRAITVDVETNDGKVYSCRTCENLLPHNENQKPSPVYKAVIVKGAIQNSLPQTYIEWLKSIEDNGYDGPSEWNEKLVLSSL